MQRAPCSSGSIACSERSSPSAPDDDDLPRPDLALVGGAEQVERARLGGDHPVAFGEAPEAERPEAAGVAERRELAVGQRDAGVGALQPLHGGGHRVLERPRRRADEGGDRLRVGAGGAAEPELVPQLGGVDEVAVVAERDGSLASVVDERLGVRPLVPARGRVADMADRELAAQASQRLRVEGRASRGRARAARSGARRRRRRSRPTPGRGAAARAGRSTPGGQRPSSPT